MLHFLAAIRRESQRALFCTCVAIRDHEVLSIFVCLQVALSFFRVFLCVTLAFCFVFFGGSAPAGHRVASSAFFFFLPRAYRCHKKGISGKLDLAVQWAFEQEEAGGEVNFKQGLAFYSSIGILQVRAEWVDIFGEK